MTDSTGDYEEKELLLFDINAYKTKNQDLRDLTDEKLFEHFKLYGHKEKRPFSYCKTTVDRFSMKYLRGEGFEIGAGEVPTPLYGETICLYGDITEHTVFGSADNDRIIYDINHPTVLLKKFDFVIASHVLEHVDSLARGLTAISGLLKNDGLAYIILPNLESDSDQTWLPKFSRTHHLIEKVWPSAFRVRHERDFCQGISNLDSKIGWGPVMQKFPKELIRDMMNGKVTPAYRYIYHRHSYSFSDWISLLLFLAKNSNPSMTLIDSSIGEERSDCHFIFKRNGDQVEA